MASTTDRTPFLRAATPWGKAAGALLAVAATTLLAFFVHRLLPHASLSLLFLTGVLVASASFGLRSALLAAVLSFLSYNFFFTTPFYTFKVDSEGDVATLAFYLLVATLTGNLAARMRREIRHRQQSLQRISRLLDFSRRMSSYTETSQVLATLAEALADQLGAGVAILAPDTDGTLATAARAGSPFEPEGSSTAEAWRRPERGWTAFGEQYWLSLDGHANPAAVVVVNAATLPLEALELGRGFCDQASIALDRILLASDLDQARVTSEREQLRSALLSSLSHDLRTPLASVIGSTSSVLEYGASLSEDSRDELLQTSLAEARRLDRYIQNLLDMTRIGRGSVTLDRNWVDIHDIVTGAVHRLSFDPARTPLHLDIAQDLPLLWVHGALIEQALVNVLDNATRFSPEGRPVVLTAGQSGDHLILEVRDEGPGIPDEDKQRVFEMFHTVSGRDGQKGTGLGLAICHSMVSAHGGAVTATDCPGGHGTCIRITLPLRQGSDSHA